MQTNSKFQVKIKNMSLESFDKVSQVFDASSYTEAEDIMARELNKMRGVPGKVEIVLMTETVLAMCGSKV
jgi:hypothetical protein